MKPGDFVKAHFTDEEGPGFHVGKIISISDKRIVFQTAHGTMDEPFDAAMHKPTTKTISVETPIAAAGKKAKAVKAGSKLDRAITLFKGLTNPSRSELIDLFMKELGMTAGGASTYASLVKKK